ncbi:MAG: hypothetical protein ACE15B_08640 [Bryobacteraceae bacterium]
MFKRFFSFSLNEDTLGPNGGYQNGNGQAAAVVEPPAAQETETAPSKSVESAASFEHIYQSAAVKPRRLEWGILKVAEMVSSAHLSGMSPEAKRCSVLMALEAAGAEVENLLQDAVVRQRALNDYEEEQRKRMEAFEAAKLEENAGIQAELDRLTKQYVSRIQANLDEIAAEQDRFRNWQKQKHAEAQRITEAAAFCVPQGGTGPGMSLAAVLERATARR